MKSLRNTAFKISTLTTALLMTYGGQAIADDDMDLAQWITPDSTVSIGAGLQDHDRPQLGIYDGRSEKGVNLMLDASINKRDDATGTWNRINATNLGLNNRQLELKHSHQGDYGISFEYDRISRESPLTFNTGLSGIGTTSQQVNLVTTPGTASQNVQLETHRDRYTLGLNKLFNGVLQGALDLNVKFRQEEKSGQRNFGTYLGSQAGFLTEPINSTTRQLDVFLNYLGKDLQLQGGYYGSWYDNAHSLITATTSSLATVYVSLPPDNQAHQFYVNGAYAISPTTKTTMRLSRTTATQNDDRLLTSGMPILASYQGTNAKIVTTEGQFGITTKPIKDLTLLANAYYQDRNDKTPHEVYSSQTPPDETTPHSFKTKNLKLEATYRVQPGFKLLGGAYYDVRERSIPFSHENSQPATPTNAGANWTVPAVSTNEREVPYRYRTNELTFKGQASKNILDELSGSLTYAHSRRNGSNFYWADQQNLINPMYMADRDRDKIGLKLDWTPTQSLSFQAQYAEAKDDYGNNGLNADYTAANGQTLSGTGLTDGRARLFSLDADFKLNDDWQVNAWYSYDQSKATQRAYQATFGTDPIRRMNLSDTGESLGIGIKGNATARITLGADLEWNRSVGKYDQSNVKDAGATLSEELPSITNKAIRLALNGTYQLDKKSSVRMDVIYDKWSTNDWSWMMWNNAQTTLVPMAYASDGTSASVSSKQTATFVAVRYVYKF